jgi:CRP/FNR family transcriptional regulator, cyclic AMP receptor protein
VAVRDAVANVDLFRGLPSSVLDDIISRGTTLRVGPGRVLVQQGAPDSGLQVIIGGSAVVSVNGVERRTLDEGAYFGEISLIDGAARSATVVAGPEGAHTFAMSPLAFSQVLDDHPEIARLLLKVLTAHIRRLESPEV